MSTVLGSDLGHTQLLLLTSHVTLGGSHHLSEAILTILAFSLNSAHPKSLIRMPASPSIGLLGWALLQATGQALSGFSAQSSPSSLPSTSVHQVCALLSLRCPLTWASSAIP